MGHQLTACLHILLARQEKCCRGRIDSHSQLGFGNPGSGPPVSLVLDSAQRTQSKVPSRADGGKSQISTILTWQKYSHQPLCHNPQALHNLTRMQNHLAIHRGNLLKFSRQVLQRLHRRASKERQAREQPHALVRSSIRTSGSTADFHYCRGRDDQDSGRLPGNHDWPVAWDATSRCNALFGAHLGRKKSAVDGRYGGRSVETHVFKLQ
mmetsp:Transcript_38710/g.84491  ORF Transcript_38710/g.84491 Transcript_38710/m.84491 type:complete len:209 (-) Transcript_38710:1052-1678(-)